MPGNNKNDRSGLDTVRSDIDEIQEHSDVVTTRYGQRQVIELPSMTVYREIAGPNPDPYLDLAPRDAEAPTLIAEYSRGGYHRENPNRAVPEAPKFSASRYYQTSRGNKAIVNSSTETSPRATPGINDGAIQAYVTSDNAVHYYYDGDGNPLKGPLPGDRPNQQQRQQVKGRSSSNLAPKGGIDRDQGFILQVSLQQGRISSIDLKNSTIGISEIPSFLEEELMQKYSEYPSLTVRVEHKHGEYYIYAAPGSGGQYYSVHPGLYGDGYNQLSPRRDHKFRDVDYGSRPVFSRGLQYAYVQPSSYSGGGMGYGYGYGDPSYNSYGMPTRVPAHDYRNFDGFGGRPV